MKKKIIAALSIMSIVEGIVNIPAFSSESIKVIRTGSNVFVNGNNYFKLRDLGEKII